MIIMMTMGISIMGNPGELLVSLYGDITSFSAHMADHHIFFNVFEMENDFRTRRLLEYRKEYAEFNDFFKLTEWN